ncbi:DsbA family protein [Chitinophaga nivalis]|uniref:DsbA family protein n=1 Tax=Chitinophaga nivalis TaxID=2991709 RepID=A0ABT3IFL6_9BACT|nr:DsbA family protein [Chitinophaga nivalis]MCW3467561.1 DsbA family protein [Chitinophaga nivalis]MCW3482747.1 DsbA family protein [Chitinophaga nivalis]
MATLTPPVNVYDHILGPAGAVVELVEYGDFQCPYCGEAFSIVKSLQDALQDTLRFVFRNFPLREAHEYALDAALAAEAAGRQQRYWEMHDAIYQHQQELDELLLARLAKDLKLDMDQFAEDLEDPRLVSKIEADFESGIRSGVNGTPTFFINGKRYDGDYRELLSALRD